MDFFLSLCCTEDFETSLSDYQKALSILEQLVEPDDRKIADLYPCHISYLDMQFYLCVYTSAGLNDSEKLKRLNKFQ